MEQLLTNNHVLNATEIEQRAQKNLQSRLGTEYTTAEIRKITSLDRSLFADLAVDLSDTESNHAVLDDEEFESMRVLCSYSRSELRPARKISSHRPIIGKFIVLVKKLTWPLVRFHLKETFESLQVFNSELVYNQARQIKKIYRLKQLIG